MKMTSFAAPPRPKRSMVNADLLKQMRSIPFFTEYDCRKRTLTLRNATEIPKRLFDFWQHIEILDASKGHISSLPDDFYRLRKVRVVWLSNHRFKTVPKVLARCPALTTVAFKSCGIASFDEDSLPPNLHWLVLTDNHIESLPQSMGKLTRLRKVALAGNHLTALPESMARCRNMELLRIGANRFKAPPPDWLFSLPKLAWYGDAGNPFNNECGCEQSTAEKIEWSEIDIGDQISESPSSTVFRGFWRTRSLEIAVKVFQNRTITSDGYPESDMRASLAAGVHPNLVPFLGKLAHAPNSKEGVVSRLMPESFRKLGMPPSLDSVTRDLFPHPVCFSMRTVPCTVRGIASAALHIHQKGLSHRDLYAHNILADAKGNALLGDFGAASFHSGKSYYEKLDVRAFGCLLEDLLGNASSPSKNAPVGLIDLKRRCLDENVEARPTFEEIVNTLR